MKPKIKRILSIIKNRKIITFIRKKTKKIKLHDSDIISYEDDRILNIKNKENPKNKSITFLIPEFGIGSGGHMTLFRIASFLEKNGYQINLVLIENKSFTDVNYTRYFINEYYVQFNPKIYLTLEDFIKQTIPINEILICTSWRTAYFLNRFPTIFKNKFYLVQDYEAQFNPMSSLYFLAENTYNFPFFKICASKWLSNIMKDKFHSNSDYFNLGYDDKIYFPKNNTRDKSSLIYYGRQETPRRGFELVIEALKIVRKHLPDITIKIYGSNNLLNTVPFSFTNLGQLSQKELSSEFNKATIGLSISLTNVSLTPAEMMACKLPTIEINHPSVSGMFQNKKEILLANPNPNDIAFKIINLIKTPKIRKEIAEQGYKKVSKNYHWINSLEKIKKIIEKNVN